MQVHFLRFSLDGISFLALLELLSDSLQVSTERRQTGVRVAVDGRRTTRLTAGKERRETDSERKRQNRLKGETLA